MSSLFKNVQEADEYSIESFDSELGAITEEIEFFTKLDSQVSHLTLGLESYDDEIDDLTLSVVEFSISAYGDIVNSSLESAPPLPSPGTNDDKKGNPDSRLKKIGEAIRKKLTTLWEKSKRVLEWLSDNIKKFVAAEKIKFGYLLGKIKAKGLTTQHMIKMVKVPVNGFDDKLDLVTDNSYKNDRATIRYYSDPKVAPSVEYLDTPITRTMLTSLGLVIKEIESRFYNVSAMEKAITKIRNVVYDNLKELKTVDRKSNQYDDMMEEIKRYNNMARFIGKVFTEERGLIGRQLKQLSAGINK